MEERMETMTKQQKKEKAKEFYTIMYRTRRFEEEVFEFYKRGLMPGLAHLYLGEEAVAAGVCGALEERDFIGSTHRGHGHLVARGADLNRMMAEILGKEAGYSKGKGGSMHIMAMDKGILGANGIVGGEIPIATGSAYASLYKGTDEVTVCFFGDSAANEGTFHESINMAAAWNLPIVYIVENNLYGISVDIRRVTKEHHIAKRAAGYGIEGITIDGNDVFQVYEEAVKAVEKARRGEGPTIIECMTYRWQGHHVGDPGVYRPDEEVAEWKEKEPLGRLKELGILTQQEMDEIAEEVEKEIQEACRFAEESPYPDMAEAYTDVFVD
ncbi:Acetoin:2%2C6-dichlorophenolindophenol oxidoreductase subunit alpha [uncultured Roseburia sp.]|nr:thiamine pyrophosphate-dependent dehydrogenase E1 component subunit alpha [Brotonthovivens ammoniilytica]SCI99515.1 Acetoin:2%2C6-dichlorophenolindophenol oxidoreductase subunit alpha [uncultured Roseburia sp.]